MIFEKIIDITSSVLSWVLDKIPNVNIDTSGFSSSILFLVDKGKALNTIFPLQEALVFVGIALTIKLAMLGFWASMRVINLLRGAG